MTKTKALLVVSVIVTFAAGTAAGLLVSRTGHGPPGPSWLASELNLTDRQRDEMHGIWSEVMRAGGRAQWEKSKAFVQERDEAIAALLTDAQRPQYDAILQECARKMEELAQEGKARFEQAIEETKKILTPEQALKYEELMKRGPGGPGDRPPGGPGGGPPGPPPPWGKGHRPHAGPREAAPEKDTAPRGGE